MRISFRWLSELLPGLTATPAEVAEILTMHSFETAVAGKLTIDPRTVVAKIIKLERHPKADRLRLATVTTGRGTVRLVCGAANISEGDLVPCALPGAKLYDDNGREFILKEVEIRGERSAGMLASPRELGLGDDARGIYILPPDVPPGTKLCDHLPADTILEADITLNRAHDCQSMLGIARELGCLLNLSVAEPRDMPLPGDSLTNWILEVIDPADAPRYLGVLIEGITLAPSPLWLQARLWVCGARPLNNVVDITNYVLFEQGNPLHAFDAAMLPEPRIIVRRARRREQIRALDGQRYSLAANHLVITSGGTPHAIAGIIGGLGSEVKNSTRAVFLEVANFQPHCIQRASAELKLITESSRRFARGLSPALVAFAARRALLLLQQYAAGTARGFVESYPNPQDVPVIAFRPSQVEHLSQLKVAAPQQADILKRLRCTVDQARIPWRVTPPPDRLDLTAEHDLAEEIIRVVGLEKIPNAALAKHPQSPWPRVVQVREYLRDTLVSAGLTEVYNRPFEHERYVNILGQTAAHALAIANPAAPELAVLRTSLLPQLCANLVANKGEVRRRHSRAGRSLFEISTVWHTGEGRRVNGVVEEEHVAAVMVDDLDPAALVAAALAGLGVAEAPDTYVIIGEFAAATLMALKLPQGIRFFSINLTDLLPRVPESFHYEPFTVMSTTKYQAPSPFPPNFRDLSLLVPPHTSTQAVREVIVRAGAPLLTKVELFDEYTPPSVRDGSHRKSFSFHLTYQAPDRTLTDTEIAAAQRHIATALKEKMDVQIRE